MDTNKFAKRVANRERARADQMEAAKAAEKLQAATNELIRTNARTDFRRFDRIADALIESANAELNFQKFIRMNNGAGFTVRYGSEYVSFNEHAPMFANEGCTIISVVRSVGFGAAQGIAHDTYLPGWDDETSSLVWQRKGWNGWLTAEELVDAVLDDLNQRGS